MNTLEPYGRASSGSSLLHRSRGGAALPQSSRTAFVSQPVLSRQIARLEQDLKARLFIRDRRSVRLTSAGEALLHHTRHLLENWDAATKEVTTLARKEQSVLVIGLQTGVGRGMLHTLTQALNAIQWRPELHQVAWNDATPGLRLGIATRDSPG